MMINTEWYRIFLHASESLNMTKAAQHLNMTQPSVSYAIKQLEEALGVKLFDRLSKGILLTEEGHALYDQVKQAFDTLDYAEHYMKQLGQLNEGRLRIGANGAIIRDYIVPLLDIFRSQYPNIRVQVSQQKTGHILEQLKQGFLDLGYVYLPVKDEEIKVVDSFVSPYCVVAGNSFASLAKAPLSAAHLAELPLLMLSSGSATRSYIEAWFQTQDVEAAADFELNSLDMLAEFAERGYGAAILPRAFVASSIKEGSLLELNMEVPLPDRSVGVAVRKHSSPSLAAEAFLHIQSSRSL
ncbi:LysR family transcriptional regulator [Paenibacillus sp. XY044]|uniref:LysR family transcriptional regulator n=1 Tax=Paenibacillus sp. XY044 TaxID=2026089 RepID=UPI000B9988AF|nr:LysR family transcriptional regulator [Paenibacillus sp. XY044]OZB95169.1 LysR family transcriptional regulator [Paenibacillus sp. XY044]